MATKVINDKQALELHNHHFPADRPKKSALTKALQDGRGGEAQRLIAERGNAGFTEEESWQIKVFKNVDFSDEEFRLLAPTTQNLVYRTANCFSKTQLVARLNLIKKFTADAPIKSPSLLSPYMDIATVKQTVGSWLKELRKQSRLLTENEFLTSACSLSWRKKGCDVGRILGRDYLERLIKELNLKYIKVPEKVAVITEGKTEVSINVSDYTKNLITVHSRSVSQSPPEGFDDDLDARIAFYRAHPPSVDINVYAQNISRVQRILNDEEVDELFTIIAAAHFTDLHLGNILVASDGIYFIDTEFNSFSGTSDWYNMRRFTQLIPQSYAVEFDRRINAEIAAEENKEKGAPATLSYDEKCTDDIVRMREARKPGKLVGGHTTRTVSFPIEDILVPNQGVTALSVLKQLVKQGKSCQLAFDTAVAEMKGSSPLGQKIALEILTELVKSGKGYYAATCAAAKGVSVPDASIQCASIDLMLALLEKGQGVKEALNTAAWTVNLEATTRWKSLALYKALFTMNEGFDSHTLNGLDALHPSASQFNESASEPDFLDLYKILVEKGYGNNRAISYVTNALSRCSDYNRWQSNNYLRYKLVNSSLELLKALVDKGEAYDIAIVAAERYLHTNTPAHVEGALNLFKALFKQNQALDLGRRISTTNAQKNHWFQGHWDTKTFDTALAAQG